MTDKSRTPRCDELADIHLQMEYSSKPSTANGRATDWRVLANEVETELTKALSDLAEAKAELRKHLTSTVDYELIDGIRQLAQVAVGEADNSRVAMGQLTNARAEVERLRKLSLRVYAACNRVEIKHYLPHGLFEEIGVEALK